jgi:RNA polymerase sigma-70 factor (ECF subfamily)
MGTTSIGAGPAVGASGTSRHRGSSARPYDRLVIVDDQVMVDPATDDVATLERMAAGDQQALGVLYDRYGRMVYAIALRITGDAQAAEECTQDAFLAAWRTASQFDADRARPCTWICAIARNRALDAARAQARRPTPHEEVHPHGEEPDTADVVQAADEAVRVAEAMAKLPPAQLEVLQLAYFDELSQTQISERLRLPLGTVKSRMRLAVDRLRSVAADMGLEA